MSSINLIDRIKEFNSVFANAKNYHISSPADYGHNMVPCPYESIHAQFQALSLEIRKEINAANNLMSSAEAINQSLERIKVSATSIAKEIQNLKSYHTSFSESAQVYCIPPPYVEHTFFICKSLEHSAKSLASRFEALVRIQPKPPNTVPLNTHASAAADVSVAISYQQSHQIYSSTPSMRGRYINTQQLAADCEIDMPSAPVASSRMLRGLKVHCVAVQ